MTQDQSSYLLSIKSVRETNSSTKALLLDNKLTNFDVDLSKLPEVVKFVCETILGTFPTEDTFKDIPGHGRYQHFEGNDKPRLTSLIESWKSSGLDDYNIAKNVIDLFIVSVLLDAGAGNLWNYKEEDGVSSNRSEGIAIASFHMFVAGAFSGDSGSPFKVNGSKLQKLSAEELTKGLQLSESNPMSGFEGRLKLMNKLGEALVTNKELFGEDGRPGNLVDYLIALPTTKKVGAEYEVDLQDLWSSLMIGLNPIWPDDERLKLNGQSLGDCWVLQSKIDLAKKDYASESEIPLEKKVVTFHKLTQWLTYSLFLPLTKFGHFKLLNSEYMTGLPEYRNGGLFVDFGLLSLKPEVKEKGLSLTKELGRSDNIPTFIPSDDIIVEWRSCTIVLLDYILPLINKELVKDEKNTLTLAQLIEAGSWKSGRLIAAKLRPDTKGPPIELLSDGTVF